MRTAALAGPFALCSSRSLHRPILALSPRPRCAVRRSLAARCVPLDRIQFIEAFRAGVAAPDETSGRRRSSTRHPRLAPIRPNVAFRKGGTGSGRPRKVTAGQQDEHARGRHDHSEQGGKPGTSHEAAACQDSMAARASFHGVRAVPLPSCVDPVHLPPLSCLLPPPCAWRARAALHQPPHPRT
jgi:hypothetical protein